MQQVIAACVTSGILSPMPPGRLLGLAGGQEAEAAGDMRAYIFANICVEDEDMNEH